MKASDLSGQRFDMVTVLCPVGRKHGYIEYLCKCDCGNEVKLGSNQLRKECRHSCGCHRLKNVPVEGHKYNHLTAIKPVGGGKFLFRCDCGIEKEISGYHVVKGLTISCGSCEFHIKEMSEKSRTHGLSDTRFYEQYRGMLKRCYDCNAINYKDYGGRGITVCDEWRNDPAAFRDWAIENGWEEGLTLDRVNNDGPYCPTNCRWVTTKEQAKNKRSNLLLSFRGQTKIAADWADELGIPRKTLYERLRKGWTVEEALSRPVRKRSRVEHDADRAN